MRSVAFGTALCEMMGLDPATVERITVVSDARDIVRVTVNMHIQDKPFEQVKHVVSALRSDDIEITFKADSPQRWSVSATHKQPADDDTDEGVVADAT